MIAHVIFQMTQNRVQNVQGTSFVNVSCETVFGVRISVVKMDENGGSSYGSIIKCEMGKT